MTRRTEVELLRDIEEHMRKMWDERLLPANCWPTDLAKRLTEAVRRAPAAPVPQGDAYGLIDRFLRNNLDDSDYAEYSTALDAIAAAPQPPEATHGIK